jgi:hypothetical protein
MTANLDARGTQAQQVIHPDDRVRGTLSICGRGACTYLQQILSRKGEVNYRQLKQAVGKSSSRFLPDIRPFPPTYLSPERGTAPV